MAASLPKLTYFDMDGGRGEPIRLAYYYGGVAFEDNRITFPQWGELKSKTPWGSLPTLEVPGKGTLGQSHAICRYVARHTNLYPTDDFKAAQVDDLLNGLEDVSLKISPTMRIQDEAQKKAARETLAKEDLPKIFEQVEKILEKASASGPFAFGDQPTIVDFSIFVLQNWLLSGKLDHIPTDLTAKYKRIVQVHKAVGDLQKTKDYYASRQAAQKK